MLALQTLELEVSQRNKSCKFYDLTLALKFCLKICDFFFFQHETESETGKIYLWWLLTIHSNLTKSFEAFAYTWVGGHASSSLNEFVSDWKMARRTGRFRGDDWSKSVTWTGPRTNGTPPGAPGAGGLRMNLLSSSDLMRPQKDATAKENHV